MEPAAGQRWRPSPALLEVISGSLRAVGEIYHGEFDPGSERTLAARLKHASRAARGSDTS